MRDLTKTLILLCKFKMIYIFGYYYFSRRNNHDKKLGTASFIDSSQSTYVKHNGLEGTKAPFSIYPGGKVQSQFVF